MSLQPQSINEIIPPELLGEIFLHCIPPDALKHQQPDVTIAPMLLCHVCSHWREIALGMPRLWTHLYHVAYLQNTIGIFDRRDRIFLRWWLARVREVPAFLRLEFKEDDGKKEDRPQETQSDDFMATMMQCMTNARYLSLDFHYDRLIRKLYEERPLSCPHLDTLVVRQGFDYLHTRSGTEDYIPVPQTQYIRRLALEDIILDLDDVSSILNFSNITHLHLCVGMTLRGWFSLLRESVNLMYGSFIIGFRGELQCPVVQPHTLPHLRQLSFQNYGQDLQQSFLDEFYLPALTGMRVDKKPSVSVDYLHRLLVSTPAVRTLHLGANYMRAAMREPASLKSIFIRGDLNPVLTSTPLSSVAPQLASIYFEAFSRLVRSDGLDLARSVLMGDWLQIGRPGNCISCVHLGLHRHQRENADIFAKLRKFVVELRKSMPPGEELALRPVEDHWLWLAQWKDGKFVDEFEDLIQLGPWVPSYH